MSNQCPKSPHDLEHQTIKQIQPIHRAHCSMGKPNVEFVISTRMSARLGNNLLQPDSSSFFEDKNQIKKKCQIKLCWLSALCWLLATYLDLSVSIHPMNLWPIYDQVYYSQWVPLLLIC